MTEATATAIAPYNADRMLEGIRKFEETGFETEEELISFFQFLVDDGRAWTLQGVYGRKAIELIEAGKVNQTTNPEDAPDSWNLKGNESL